MFEKTIKYTDYNNVERTEKFYFNLSKAELTEMQLSEAGGFSELVERIVNSQDVPELSRIFKYIVTKAYGVKSNDGKRMIKNPELTQEFLETEAYSELYIELLTDTKALADFIKGIIPRDIAENLTTDETGQLMVIEK